MADGGGCHLRVQLKQHGLAAARHNVENIGINALIWRLIEILPLSLAARQTLLEQDSMQDMLATLHALLQGLA